MDGQWFQFGRKQGISSAQKEKILAPEISFGGNFAYDVNGEFYSTTKIYGYIKNDNIKESYKFWLGLFNSRLFWFFIQQTGYVLRGGYFTFKTAYIHPFPVPAEIPSSVVLSIEKLVDNILKAKENSDQFMVTELEKQVDNIIYELYNISHLEIQIINGIK
ncbi:TaqI-like C-terminal specificity domain-containing protein [Mucilaginibacter sp.]|uniref:TaqI-like C-terminal specificity domain-containing protein n=1 Tax=Mucilaginibacter sp. TaxID=1882438 RepID=UPI002846107A|nr:TaqI-like C-terminal specificity domain-containing protein [Mucilaginibacter sp.]MDR3694550.1 TaqI-like C-terminal specificity domain-containing protein [Mucilaginibacter sp.]